MNNQEYKLKKLLEAYSEQSINNEVSAYNDEIRAEADLCHECCSCMHTCCISCG